MCEADKSYPTLYMKNNDWRYPYVIGVTGGIGSGKSVIARLLQLMGVPVYDCDSKAKQLMCINEGVRKALVETVGKAVYNDDSTLNRAYLSSYMFGHPERVTSVNAIVHPAVRADFRQWAQLSKCPLVAVESAILYEAGMENDVDTIWLVQASEALRLQRAMLRDGTDEAAIKRCMQSQMSGEQLMHRANSIVYNDGEHSLIAQVCHLLRKIRT